MTKDNNCVVKKLSRFQQKMLHNIVCQHTDASSISINRLLHCHLSSGPGCRHLRWDYHFSSQASASSVSTERNSLAGSSLLVLDAGTCVGITNHTAQFIPSSSIIINLEQFFSKVISYSRMQVLVLGLPHGTTIQTLLQFEMKAPLRLFHHMA